MKKILLAITGAFQIGGGIATVNRLVLRSIVEAGYDVEVFALVEDKIELDNRWKNGKKITYRIFQNRKVPFVLAVWHSILKNDYDLVFCDHVNLAAMLAPLSAAGCCRYIVWLFGSEVFPPKPDLEGRLGLRFAWKRLAISDFTRKKVLESFPQHHVTACDLALEPERNPQNLSKNLVQSETTIEMQAVDGSGQQLRGQVILHVGRMSSAEQYKGQDTLLEAFPTIFQQFPDVQLLLVGKGDDLSRLRALAESLPLSMQSAIFMPGYVDDAFLNELYRVCYLFAMPSWGEGFGLVYLEAMAHVKPCLGGGMDAASCVIRDGLTGLIVENPKSPKQLAAKISWLLAHPEEARQMGQAGYKLVESYYRFAHFKKRFWNAVAE